MAYCFWYVASLERARIRHGLEFLQLAFTDEVVGESSVLIYKIDNEAASLQHTYWSLISCGLIIPHVGGRLISEDQNTILTELYL